MPDLSNQGPFFGPANFLNNEGIMKTIMNEPKFENLLQRIGCGLSRLRIDKGYKTIKDFAAEYSLPSIQYWRIEKGKANITFKTLVSLLSIHEISVDDFFSLVRVSC
jgi:hypothetical protein